MAAKPAPKGTAKHPAAGGTATKHAGTPNGAAKHNAKAPPKKAAGKKPAAKHHPAKKAPKKPTLQQQVAKLVAADVKKALAAQAKQQPTVQKRGAAVLDGIPWCAVESLAASLRIAGKAVGGDDLLTLHYLAGGSADSPTTILAALMAAQEHGLGGAYPEFGLPDTWTRLDGLVVGVTIPAGPHSVVLDQGGVWSWGDWHELTRPLVIEEAWSVSWH